MLLTYEELTAYSETCTQNVRLKLDIYALFLEESNFFVNAFHVPHCARVH